MRLFYVAFQGELGGGAGSGPEWLLPGSPLLFQDRMMSGCDTVTGEHSYSSQQEATVGSQESDDTVHQFVLPHIKMEEGQFTVVIQTANRTDVSVKASFANGSRIK